MRNKLSSKLLLLIILCLFQVIISESLFSKHPIQKPEQIFSRPRSSKVAEYCHLMSALYNRDVNIVVERIIKNNGEVPKEYFGDKFFFRRSYGAFPCNDYIPFFVPIVHFEKLNESNFIKEREIVDAFRVAEMKRHRLDGAFLQEYAEELAKERGTLFDEEGYIYYMAPNTTQTLSKMNDLYIAAITLFDASEVNSTWRKAPMEKFLGIDFPERSIKDEKVAVIELVGAYKNKLFHDQELSNFVFHSILKDVATYIDTRYVQRGIKVVIRGLTSLYGANLFCGPHYKFDLEAVVKYQEGNTQNLQIDKSVNKKDIKRLIVDRSDPNGKLAMIYTDGKSFVENFGSWWPDWQAGIRQQGQNYFDLPYDPMLHRSAFFEGMNELIKKAGWDIHDPLALQTLIRPEKRDYFPGYFFVENEVPTLSRWSLTDGMHPCQLHLVPRGNYPLYGRGEKEVGF